MQSISGQSCMTNDFNPADLDAVKQKYEQESARRLRADGVAQYLPMSGQFAGMSDDPHTEKMERQPVVGRLKVGNSMRFISPNTSRRPEQRGLGDWSCEKESIAAG